MHFFGPKILFFWTFFKIFDTIMTGHQNDNIFVLTRCTAGPGAAAGAHFWPENLHFFYATPI